jgi:hypothetical protein
METMPVSRASLETKCAGIRLQSCPSTLSLGTVPSVLDTSLQSAAVSLLRDRDDIPSQNHPSGKADLCL